MSGPTTGTYAIEHHTDASGARKLITTVTGERWRAREVRNKHRARLKGQGVVHERWVGP